MRDELTYQILKTIPLFKETDDSYLNLIIDQARFVDLEKGAFVFHKGALCKGFYVVVHGSLKISFISMEGKEHVVRIVGPGQSFGEAAMFLNKPFPATAQTMSQVKALFIPKEVVFQCINENPSFALGMLAGLSRRVHLFASRLESLALDSSQQRVIGYLLQHQRPVDAKHGRKNVDLPANKATIASHLNLAPETLSRVLQQLSESGLISVEGKVICILDEEKLREFNM
ncbi:MAG: Crp/Fnr family transcriptional regulator [Mariprofundaceae bacterium]|nr:Crp/Fnr family transcriptional regulator [Mariprofundaceae bacterium]